MLEIMRKLSLIYILLVLTSGVISSGNNTFLPSKQTSVVSNTQKGEPPLIPLLWIRGESEDTIRLAIREVARAGNTGFILESRPHPHWGGEEWWSDLGVVAEEAEKNNLDIWLFDDHKFPSGRGGGLVLQEAPELVAHVLTEQTINCQGPTGTRQWEIPQPLNKNEVVLGVTAFSKGQKPVQINYDGNGEKINWSVPDGSWKITWSIDRTDVNSDWPDLMNPRSSEVFIQKVHIPAKKILGKRFRGFFSDETGLRSTWPKDLPFGIQGETMAWSPLLPDEFKKLKGYDITPWLPALWYDLGDETRKIRHDYMDVVSRTFAESFFGTQREWCNQNGLRLIGHLIEGNTRDYNIGGGPGHWFKAIAEFDMPGIDVIGYQVVPGLEHGTVDWQTRWPHKMEVEFFQFALPAMARGAALLHGRNGTREIMSETFGAYGWDEGLRMMKWIGDWHIVNGIAVVAPHAFTMMKNDPTCPPTFNPIGGNPQAGYYKYWSEPFKKLQSIVLNSDPVYEAAVLYTAESRWAGKADLPDEIVHSLEKRQISSVVIPYDALEDMKVKEGLIKLRDQELSFLILPFVKYIPAPVMEKLADLAESGGNVIIIGPWPDAAIDNNTNERFLAARNRLKNIEYILIPAWELPLSLKERKIKLDAPVPTVQVSKRRTTEGEWLIVHNRSIEGPVNVNLQLETGFKNAVRYDPFLDKYWQVPFNKTGNNATIGLDIPVYGLHCILLTDKEIDAEKSINYIDKNILSGYWKVSPKNEDKIVFNGELSEPYSWTNWTGMENYTGTVKYEINADVPEGAKAIEINEAAEVAELFMDGNSIGVRICPPYRWDIAEFPKKSNMNIRIEVTNTADTKWGDRYSKDYPDGGILGDVFWLK